MRGHTIAKNTFGKFIKIHYPGLRPALRHIETDTVNPVCGFDKMFLDNYDAHSAAGYTMLFKTLEAS